jgi:DNA-binding SARP family transcriptional activator
MEFRILGPLEAREGDRVVPLGGVRQRAVLAVLILHANRVVSSDRLIDEIWGEEPPKTAATTLRVFVSELRKILEPSRGREDQILLTRAPGYLLRVQPGTLDLERFERLFERGRESHAAGAFAAAATRLREALGLWHGPALADFAFEPFAQAAIARLEEMRLAALEASVLGQLGSEQL